MNSNCVILKVSFQTYLSVKKIMAQAQSSKSKLCDTDFGYVCTVCGQEILLSVHCDPDLEDMTLGQGHDTPLGHEQQLC